MNSGLMFSNYKKSLNQKYYAVCFGVDGVLTKKGSKDLDDRAISMIINLLKRKVPVVFITGRGETGLGDLKRSIYDKVKNSVNITGDDLKRIYVLTNDGARLFYSDKVEKDDFLSCDTYISTEEELQELEDIDKKLYSIRKIAELNKYFNKTYSFDTKNKIILNIRLVFNINDYDFVYEVYDDAVKYLEQNNYNNVHLSLGVYQGKPVIQFGTATKDAAIKRAERTIGIPQNSMLRVGDCGDERGNDYAMLKCTQGYSIDKVSKDVDSCFPVFDDDGNILTGVDATLYLIDNAKILPTVCLEKADKKDYKYNLASVENNISSGRNKLLRKYNDIINSNFDAFNGIDSIFDSLTGSVKMPMFELEYIKDNPLKEFWLSSNNESLKYSLRDDNNYLLRGADTYYYFLANRQSANNSDITTKDNVISWHSNYIGFLEEAFNAISLTKNVNDKYNKKFTLGILDNCRNILLIIMNHGMVNSHFDQNIILDISSCNNELFYKMYQALLKVDTLMSNICFKSQYIINSDDVLDSINQTKYIVENNLNNEYLKSEKENYSKDYRAYREIDNFAENYVAVSLHDENRKNYNDYINSCGLCYGGMELPIISKIISKSKVEKLLLLMFNTKVSGYSTKQLIDLREFNICNYGGLIGAKDLDNPNVDLFDDNVLTGKTLQLAVNSLYDFDIMVDNICIVRYPGINRVDQMFIDNTAAVDYKLFFDYIYGLCFSSPYSWKDDAWKTKEGKVDYTDSFGKFDLGRNKIVECLIKNHCFNPKSEVGEYQRRYIKK